MKTPSKISSALKLRAHQYGACVRQHPHQRIEAVRNLVCEDCGWEWQVVGQRLGRSIVDLPCGVLEICSITAACHQTATHNEDVSGRKCEQGWVPPALQSPHEPSCSSWSATNGHFVKSLHNCKAEALTTRQAIRHFSRCSCKLCSIGFTLASNLRQGCSCQGWAVGQLVAGCSSLSLCLPPPSCC